MSRVVGVTIATKSPHTKDKIYYYRTSEDLKRGQKISAKMESGGTPDAVVVVQNSKKKISNVKDLEIIND